MITTTLTSFLETKIRSNGGRKWWDTGLRSGLLLTSRRGRKISSLLTNVLWKILTEAMTTAPLYSRGKPLIYFQNICQARRLRSSGDTSLLPSMVWSKVTSITCIIWVARLWRETLKKTYLNSCWEWKELFWWNKSGQWKCLSKLQTLSGTSNSNIDKEVEIANDYLFWVMILISRSN